MLTHTTRIRTWFAASRHGVEALFQPHGTAGAMTLNVTYWQAMEDRVLYAQHTYPWVQLQLILFGEDFATLSAAAGVPPTPTAARRRGGGGAPAAPATAASFAARYAQARWSALPAVHFCVVNDAWPEYAPAAAAVGAAMHAREAWGTLLTTHQRRWSGYAHAAAPWSSIVTLQTKDATQGAEIAEYRAMQRGPVVMEEVRTVWCGLCAVCVCARGGGESTSPRRHMWRTLGLHEALRATRASPQCQPPRRA